MPLGVGDKGVGWSWGLEFEKTVIDQIQEVSGLKMEVDTIENKHNTAGGKYAPSYNPGRPKMGEITLTRAVTQEATFEDWIKQVYKGDMKDARRTGSIILFDHMGAPLKRFNVARAWPKSLEYGGLKAGDTSLLTEKLVLVHEGIEVAK